MFIVNVLRIAAQDNIAARLHSPRAIYDNHHHLSCALLLTPRPWWRVFSAFPWPFILVFSIVLAWVMLSYFLAVARQKKCAQRPVEDET
jgi:hypothetical protein